MPKLDNPRHEHFAQLLATGRAADAAYEEVGCQANRGNASRLKSNDSIQARVAELQRRALQRHDVSVDSLTRELEEARELALKCEQGSAAVSATLAKAKLHGLLIERRETGQPGAFDDLTDDELDRRQADIERRIAELGGGPAPDPAGAIPETRH